MSQKQTIISLRSSLSNKQLSKPDLENKLSGGNSRRLTDRANIPPWLGFFGECNLMKQKEFS